MTPKTEDCTTWTRDELKSLEHHLGQMKRLLETTFAPHVVLASLNTPSGVLSEARAMLNQMAMWIPE